MGSKKTRGIAGIAGLIGAGIAYAFGSDIYGFVKRLVAGDSPKAELAFAPAFVGLAVTAMVWLILDYIRVRRRIAEQDGRFDALNDWLLGEHGHAFDAWLDRQPKERREAASISLIYRLGMYRDFERDFRGEG